jgi:SAM-dependent methyltransferase
MSLPGLLNRRRLRRKVVDPHPAAESLLADDYYPRHSALVKDVLAEPGMMSLFASPARLPPGFGFGWDERVVELPWILSQRLTGRLLDAGSTLNHAHIVDRCLQMVDSMTITTITPEPTTFTDRGVSYVYCDLRELPFRDDWFETVVCASTIEHVGMDGRIYGNEAPRAHDPAREQRRAFEELRRVLRPGGSLLITVPFGRAEDHGWFRQLDADQLDELIGGVAVADQRTTIYSYGVGGWRLSSRAEAADLSYRDVHADPNPPADRAMAARAVACVKMRFDRNG